MVSRVDVQDAEAQWSRLLERVEAGEEIILARGGRPIARLAPLHPIRGRKFGFVGYELPGSFFEELSDDELDRWG